MARAATKKLSDWSTIEPLKRVTDDELKSKIVGSYNVLWKKKDFAVLEDFHGGYTEPEMVGYVVIEDELYSAHRTVCPRGDESGLQGFLITAPALVDLSDFFKGKKVEDAIEMSPKLRKHLLGVFEEVRQAVVAEWVKAIKKTPKSSKLNDVLRQMKPLSWDWGWDRDGLILPVVSALGEREYSPLETLLFHVMRREEIHLPDWCGENPKVTTKYFGRNDVGHRGWYEYEEGVPFVGILHLDKGALGIVINSTGLCAQDYVERLTDQGYGDVVLLEGPARAVAAEARKLSNYLLGVDIIQFE
jgi:hypothetical protein